MTAAPTPEQVAAAAGRFQHAPECLRPRLHGSIGREDGRPVIICGNCHKVRPLEILTGPPSRRREPDPPTAPTTPTARPAPWLTHRCREHCAPVNWKGRGCPRCDRDRARPRRKTQPTDTTE